MIENQSTYAKIKILRSLFSKRMKKPFHVMVFKDRNEKIAYDGFLVTLPNCSRKYSKKHMNELREQHVKEPMIKSSTLNKKEKPITLMYYLKD